ncbi:MAG: hypothetical protein WAO61_04260 [Solirubrobacterales bacterium]
MTLTHLTPGLLQPTDLETSSKGEQKDRSENTQRDGGSLIRNRPNVRPKERDDGKNAQRDGCKLRMARISHEQDTSPNKQRYTPRNDASDHVDNNAHSPPAAEGRQIIRVRHGATRLHWYSKININSRSGQRCLANP